MSAGANYIVELDGDEWDGDASRLADADAVREVLARVAAGDSAEVWVLRDRGPRRRGWLGRLFGAPARDIEPCFCLVKAGGVATLTFLDAAWSEYRATDADHPTAPTQAERMALSGGEPRPAALEVCLQPDRALAAAIEYLARGERPVWLGYRVVR